MSEGELFISWKLLAGGGPSERYLFIQFSKPCAIITKADCSRPVIIMAAVIIVNATVSYSLTESTTVAATIKICIRAYGLHNPECTIKTTVKIVNKAK